MQSGIDMISELTGLDDKIKDWDVLITGEGMFDHQTLEGKVISRLVSLLILLDYSRKLMNIKNM